MLKLASRSERPCPQCGHRDNWFLAHHTVTRSGRLPIGHVYPYVCGCGYYSEHYADPARIPPELANATPDHHYPHPRRRRSG